jgi:hypothetical protein
LLKIGLYAIDREATMRCFYRGQTREKAGSENFNSFVSFTIPDIGITFRAQFNGSQDECEYASLLALLEFVELNPHLFKNKRIEIFGDNHKIIGQVNQMIKAPKDLEPYLNLAVGYKRKFPFTLKWIPVNENPAQDGLTI